MVFICRCKPRKIYGAFLNIKTEGFNLSDVVWLSQNLVKRQFNGRSYRVILNELLLSHECKVHAVAQMVVCATMAELPQ